MSQKSSLLVGSARGAASSLEGGSCGQSGRARAAPGHCPALPSSPVSPGAASAATAGARKQPCFISRGNSSKTPKHFDFGKVFIPVKIRKAPLARCKSPQEGLQPTCLGAWQSRAERAEQANEPMATSSITAGLARDRSRPCCHGTGPCPLPGSGMWWGDLERGWAPPGTGDREVPPSSIAGTASHRDHGSVARMLLPAPGLAGGMCLDVGAVK